MHVAAHQEKEENEETKTGNRNAGEERNQAINDKDAAWCPSAGQHGEKMVCARGVPKVAGTFGKANSHFDPTQTGSGTAPPR